MDRRNREPFDLSTPMNLDLELKSSSLLFPTFIDQEEVKVYMSLILRRQGTLVRNGSSLISTGRFTFVLTV